MNLMSKRVIVIGGGVAGMEAAGRLSKAGLDVTIVEKEKVTGGHINNWFKLFPDRRAGSEVKDYLVRLTSAGNIKFLTSSTVEKFQRKGSIFSLLTSNGETIEAEAVIVATGFDLFRSSRKEEYGYGIYDNVITSADLEKMFREEKISIKNGLPPRTIGIVHCVGSRDEKVGNLYCSKLCCVTAVKQAIELREALSESKVFCFYMDMRMGGALYEELYREAQEKWGVNFIRGKVSEVSENIDGRLVVKVEDTLAGRPLKMEIEMLILMAGMEISGEGKRLSGIAGLDRGENGFFKAADHHFGSNISNLDGVYYAGTCTAPMNVTETISHARAAVSEVLDYLGNGKM
jgi:heterodisulfide reductase subunit A